MSAKLIRVEGRTVKIELTIELSQFARKSGQGVR